METVLRSLSEEETRRIGERIGRELSGGDVVALSGGLGSGKTCLTQGIARGLGIPETEAVSPTYILIRELEGRLRLFHVDLYRLRDREDLENTGFFETFSEDAVTVIEWADRFPDLVPGPHLEIRLRRVDDTTREFLFRARGERYASLVRRLIQVAEAREGQGGGEGPGGPSRGKGC